MPSMVRTGFSENKHSLVIKGVMAIVSRYLTAHWRGRLLLPLSYWANLVLIQKAFSESLAYMSDKISHGLEVAIAGLIAASLVWPIVGAWRSATMYSASSTRIWGILLSWR